jgi:hypothetical protein
VKLASYSPELQPAQRLWQLVDEPVTNRRLARISTSWKAWW